MAIFPKLRRRLSNLGSRGVDSRMIRTARKLEQQSHATGNYASAHLGGTLSDYNRSFGVDFRKVVQKFVEKKGTCSVLDVSTGRGFFLNVLKREFGASVSTTGTSVTRLPKELQNGIDAFFVGLTSNGRFLKTEKKYDLVVCRSGETQAMSLQQLTDFLARKLGQEGKAFVDVGNLGPNELRFVRELNRRSFRARILKQHLGFEKHGKVTMLEITHSSRK